MLRAAIISDVHGNLEALKAVLNDIDGQHIDEILCLGDIVGYGPNPVECLELVRSRCSIVIRGNHDDAVVREPINFSPIARDAIRWTRRALRDRSAASSSRWRFLERLPLTATWRGYLLVHGSPRDPTVEYITRRDLGDRKKFAEIFAMFERVCFVGHTHIPGVFYEFSDGARFVPQQSLPNSFRFEGVKMIINVGSVGQPRDHDSRACYLTMDLATEAFEFHRVEYELRNTQEKIYSIETLDPKLGNRLAAGV